MQKDVKINKNVMFGDTETWECNNLIDSEYNTFREFKRELAKIIFWIVF